jgi:nucleoside-diphosphate-sugar epimerase
VESARLQKVERLILASSIMVVWGAGVTERFITLDDEVGPTCHYALTKLYAELMAKLYAKEYGHSTIAFRLGWLPRTEEHCDRLAAAPEFQSVYLSAGDAVRGFACAVESQTPQVGDSAVLFLTSKRIGDNGVDLSQTKAVIGYEPQDKWPQNLSPHLRPRE